jgi:8-oxo-dGTP pyrophosphatase MutT (NUDIX family)
MSSPAHPAATVVLLRDGALGLELLLVRRNTRLDFHGGAWVFPGGRIDDEDYARAGSRDPVVAARWAAVREAREEAGVAIVEPDLVLVSRWVTPEGLPKRFDTWFFAGPAAAEDVRVDGGEIHEHRWFRPDDALAAHRRGEIELPPPTFVTIQGLVGPEPASAVLHRLAEQPLQTFLPRLHIVPGGAYSLYEGDAAYEGGELDRPGPRHRLWMCDQGWRYERTKNPESRIQNPRGFKP